MENSSWLLQRLKKPYTKEAKTPIEAMAKYGLSATGLSHKAREILSEVCIFDYMGSAAYEFGAIPKTLRKMAGEKLVRAQFPVPYYYKHWRDKNPSEGFRTVYTICKQEDFQEVTNRILKFAVGDPSMRCKEMHEVDASLAEHEYSKDVHGWLELDNGYMFFKSATMWFDFCKLFDVVENAV